MNVAEAIVPLLYSSGLDRADLETLIRGLSGLPGGDTAPAALGTLCSPMTADLVSSGNSLSITPHCTDWQLRP